MAVKEQEPPTFPVGSGPSPRLGARPQDARDGSLRAWSQRETRDSRLGIRMTFPAGVGLSLRAAEAQLDTGEQVTWLQTQVCLDDWSDRGAGGAEAEDHGSRHLCASARQPDLTAPTGRALEWAQRWLAPVPGGLEPLPGSGIFWKHLYSDVW